MTVAYDAPHRGWSRESHSTICLEDRFEVLKDIGDGSFGSVALARVRGAGANIARRGTLVAIKTMKKTFDSFMHCMELREVIFLRTLPNHPHLVPALDIFLDPYTKKLHIAMEYMDGNLYQLMKARDHKPLDAASVKSILFQIMGGLEHIHAHAFFHRDIKPENILVSTSAPHDSGSSFKRYSALVTPPSTPPAYTIKIADFGLARETHSKLPYTTYVSTRWYRAPEVLLRAGEYSAPVDIWAVGAMAVEIATLKPLFPGGNEVDQVWRVCEIMGSPGNWVNKQGQKIGGGEWKDGVRLAQKLGFSFPKMAPHSMDSFLQAPHWPASLAKFVTWCLMWDPKGRPTSTQALQHEYFQDAYDPMRPKSSASRLLGRKQSDLSSKDASESTTSLTSKTSWFRRSLVARESAPAVAQHIPVQARPPSPRPTPTHSITTDTVPSVANVRPNATKRATWTNGTSVTGAPIPILPTIRPISPLSDAVTAQASVRPVDRDERAAKKIGRQLSQASHGNHYTELHRQEAERALNGQSGLASPTSAQKEGFFSHLRKRARRLSGRYQAPMSPNSDDLEANAGCVPWSSTRHSMVMEPPIAPSPYVLPNLAEMNRNSNLDMTGPSAYANKPITKVNASPMLKRHHSVPHPQEMRSIENPTIGPISSRTRRALQRQPNPSNQYDVPNEEEELLDEALTSAHAAAQRLDHNSQVVYQQQQQAMAYSNMVRPSQVEANPLLPYPSPSPSSTKYGMSVEPPHYQTPSKPMDISKANRGNKDDPVSKWPTPPYEENEWAAAASASIFAAQNMYR